MSGGSQENQVLSQAEIDAMLGNAEGASELDAPLMASPAPHAGSAASTEFQPPVIWSTASPTTPLPLREETAEPPPSPPSRSPDGGAKAGRPGFLRRILGKGDAGVVAEAPSTSTTMPPTPPRSGPALDIEDDLVPPSADQTPDPLNAADLEVDNGPANETGPASAHALDAAGDVMSVFLEDEGVDPLMRRLIEKVPDVTIDDLLEELREVGALLGIARSASAQAEAA